MASRKRSPSHPIPEMETEPTNLADSVFLPLEGYTVSQWHRLPDGKGSPEAIALSMTTTAEFIVATASQIVKMGATHKTEIAMVLRIKSRKEANRLINVLTLHADEVWPVQ